jgi:tetratricopeptide (TPR) repeat protein
MRWAFTAVHESNWHPLTWLSHMIDVELYGLNPRGHHLTNVFFHLAATLLLFALLSRLTSAPWRSACVAALFALHPTHVESVAWVAERKDVLSACFWFLTLLLYAEYAAKGRRTYYLLALGAFSLGLMAKPMLVTLPVILLLIDLWPLNRFGLAEQPGQNQRRINISALLPLVKEKIPFFACSLVSSAITIYAQGTGGAIQSIEKIPLGLRLANAVTAYVKYLGKLLWPTDLAVFYPLPSAIPLWQVSGALLLLLAITAAVIRYRQSQPWLATGWFWFVITLIPVIGLVQVGTQAMADRYTYLPSVGLFIAAAWGVPALLQPLPFRKSLLAALAGIAVIASAALTWRQLPTWQDSLTLYRHALAVTTGNDKIHYNYGLALVGRQQADAAIAEFRKAIAINPHFLDAHNNLGAALAGQGRVDEAIAAYQQAIQANSNYVLAYHNLGIAYYRRGQYDQAIAQFQQALRIDPGNAEARKNLGIVMELRRKAGNNGNSQPIR